ncbi:MULTISPECIES: hypothetical protein [unclassified Microbacterium]|uniref:hypothetical protein n=1 Tax=unclassified Microbacterium TaxID=2609290 RepID=UPI00214B7E98|nr:MULTISPECIES: hypothetical protein [unclassified Microbacterium]MCR2784064.1 hypothetical protein [Microbacterium sp. zg.B96]MDL5351018.1 hypothetical protein [Microbacterium sp. zg-YB36]WIM15096.1 hypothetical protein QNO11_11130 [Microbacterium sp. zg-B96]
MSDFRGMWGFGWGFFLVGVILYLGMIALVLWVGYLIVRTGVKNGILLADQERAAVAAGRTGPPAPAGWYDTAAGRRYWDGRNWSAPPTTG